MERCNRRYDSRFRESSNANSCPPSCTYTCTRVHEGARGRVLFTQESHFPCSTSQVLQRVSETTRGRNNQRGCLYAARNANARHAYASPRKAWLTRYFFSRYFFFTICLEVRQKELFCIRDVLYFSCICFLIM